MREPRYLLPALQLISQRPLRNEWRMVAHRAYSPLQSPERYFPQNKCMGRGLPPGGSVLTLLPPRWIIWFLVPHVVNLSPIQQMVHPRTRRVKVLYLCRTRTWFSSTFLPLMSHLSSPGTSPPLRGIKVSPPMVINTHVQCVGSALPKHVDTCRTKFVPSSCPPVSETAKIYPSDAKKSHLAGFGPPSSS